MSDSITANGLNDLFGLFLWFLFLFEVAIADLGQHFIFEIKLRADHTDNHIPVFQDERVVL